MFFGLNLKKSSLTNSGRTFEAPFLPLPYPRFNKQTTTLKNRFCFNLECWFRTFYSAFEKCKLKLDGVVFCGLKVKQIKSNQHQGGLWCYLSPSKTNFLKRTLFFWKKKLVKILWNWVPFGGSKIKNQFSKQPRLGLWSWS